MHKSLAKGFRLHATDGQICNKTHREEIFRDSILSYSCIKVIDLSTLRWIDIHKDVQSYTEMINRLT